MPKSKTRRKTAHIRRQHKGCAPTSRSVGVAPALRTPLSRPPYIWTVPTAIGLPATEIETRRLNHSPDLYEFPVSPSTKVRPHDPSALADYESTQVAVAIGAGMRGDVLESISEHARETLIECSPGINRFEEAFAELFSHGEIDIKTPTDELVEWLDEMYLGTWADPSWAVGVFLRDIPGTHSVSAAVRQTAYERLYSYLPVRELVLASGRVIVSLEKPVNEDERFLINQYMLHNQIPYVIQL